MKITSVTLTTSWCFPAISTGFPAPILSISQEMSRSSSCESVFIFCTLSHSRTSEPELFSATMWVTESLQNARQSYKMKGLSKSYAFLFPWGVQSVSSDGERCTLDLTIGMENLGLHARESYFHYCNNSGFCNMTDTRKIKKTLERLWLSHQGQPHFKRSQKPGWEVGSYFLELWSQWRLLWARHW